MNGYDLSTLPEWMGGGSNPYKDYRFWAGSSTPEFANFTVDKNGKVKMIGGTFSSSASGQRIEIENDGTYLIWAGSGTKVDSNATFFIKLDGTGFVSGSFFAGQIIETNFNQGITNASITHNSAGNPVELTISSEGSGSARTTNSPLPNGGEGTAVYYLNYNIKRGPSIIDSGQAAVTRYVERDFEAGGYYTRDSYNFSTVVSDTTTVSASYDYSVEVDSIQLSTRKQKVSIRSYEDLLTS